MKKDPPTWDEFGFSEEERVILRALRDQIQAEYDSLEEQDGLSSPEFAARMDKLFKNYEETLEKKALLARVGAIIRHCRNTHGWRIKDLAETAGVSPAYLGRIERGLVDVPLKTLDRILLPLDMDLKIISKKYRHATHICGETLDQRIGCALHTLSCLLSIPLEEIAHQCDLPVSHLRRMECGGAHVTLGTAQKVVKCLDHYLDVLPKAWDGLDANLILPNPFADKD